MKAALTSSFFLDNGSLCIIETTWLGQSQWILLHKKTLDIKTLQFGSKDNSAEVEERFFDLGYLKFDSRQGVFIEKYNAALHHLDNKSGEKVPEAYMSVIYNYLNKINIPSWETAVSYPAMC